MPSSQAATNPACHLERSAFNAAFYELGLRWHWDDTTYEQLSSVH